MGVRQPLTSPLDLSFTVPSLQVPARSADVFGTLPKNNDFPTMDRSSGGIGSSMHGSGRVHGLPKKGQSTPLPTTSATATGSSSGLADTPSSSSQVYASPHPASSSSIESQRHPSPARTRIVAHRLQPPPAGLRYALPPSGNSMGSTSQPLATIHSVDHSNPSSNRS